MIGTQFIKQQIDEGHLLLRVIPLSPPTTIRNLLNFQQVSLLLYELVLLNCLLFSVVILNFHFLTHIELIMKIVVIFIDQLQSSID